VAVRETIVCKPLYFGQKDLSAAGKGFGQDLVEKLIGQSLKAIRVKISTTTVELEKATEALAAVQGDADEMQERCGQLEDVKFRLEQFDKHGVRVKLEKQVEFKRAAAFCENVDDAAEEWRGSLEGVIDEAEEAFSREDRLPIALLNTIEGWLDASGADDLAEWSHAYLAHAGDPVNRQRIAALMVTMNKTTRAIKALARVTEAISAYILFAGGRMNSLMPIAQFDQFQNLEKPILRTGAKDDAYQIWEKLSDERDQFLDGVDVELIGTVRPGEAGT
jgi:hypothetical protein